MLIFALNEKNFNNLDFATFEGIFNLMVQFRHKLFDDEYFNSQIPYMERVFEIVKFHVPYFWLFLDEKTLKTQGFCYLYDVVPSKSGIHTASASICFDKKHWGKPAYYGAKRLMLKLFLEYRVYKIKAECYNSNFYMPKFLTKLGFQLEAILKNETVVRNQPKDINIWSIFNPFIRF